MTHYVNVQVDLMHRCIYGIVHPDDHHELKVALEHSLQNRTLAQSKQVGLYTYSYHMYSVFMNASIEF